MHPPYYIKGLISLKKKSFEQQCILYYYYFFNCFYYICHELAFDGDMALKENNSMLFCPKNFQKWFMNG